MLGFSDLGFDLQILDTVHGNLMLHSILSVLIHSEGPVLEGPLLRDELRRHSELRHIVNPIEIYGRVPRPRCVQRHSVRCTVQNPIRYSLPKISNLKINKKSIQHGAE